MGISTNHATFDGLGFKHFLQNLASLAANKPLAVTPCNDRQLLAARSPPRVTFPHPELLKLTTIDQADSKPSVFEVTQEDLDIKVFRLSSTTISHLKEKAKPSDADAAADNPGKRRITSFNVVTALIWRCKALSSSAENNMERQSNILYAVDIRQRLNPPLPLSYTGNAVMSAYATAQCKELELWPFSRTVEMVSEGAKRMTDDYVRSAIDFGELYKGIPHGEVLVSSWWRLGFAEVEYPWGKPKYSCPVVYHRKDIILLFPDLEDEEEGGGGVNVLVALPPKEMDIFQTLFHKVLA